jgi:hypothetical protein
VILLFERLKYRQALKEYKSIVSGIDKLSFALLNDLSSPEQFNANEENIELMILSGILDLNDLLIRYEENALSLLSTTVSFSSYHNNVKIFSELLRMKVEVQRDTLQINTLSTATKLGALNSDDEDAQDMAEKTTQRMMFKRQKTLTNIAMKHAELLRNVSSIRSAIRAESIDIVTDVDIIKKRHVPRKERKQMKIEIRHINNEEEKNKKE